MSDESKVWTQSHDWTYLHGSVVEGHRVASGQNRDPRFPEGTLAVQIPHFLALGLDLRMYYRATLNVSFVPYRFVPKVPVARFRQLKWCPTEPAEDFSFFDCAVAVPGDPLRSGLIYYPHPETKPEHFQSHHVLEILTTRLPGIDYGVEVITGIDTNQIRPALLL